MSLLGRITNNWPMKLWAVVLAFGLWFWHILASNPVETLEMRLAVTLEGTQGDKQYTVVDPQPIRTALRAPRNVIRELEKRQAYIRVIADVEQLKADAEHNVQVHAECEAPGFEDLRALGVEQELEPKVIRVRVTQLDRKTVEVQLVYTAPAPPGLGKPTLVPEEVEVRGTRDAVAPVKAVKAFVNPADLLPRPYLVVPVRPVGEQGEYLVATHLEIDPPEVTVSAAPERRVSKLVRVEPRLEGQVAEGYQLGKPAAVPATVEVTGDAQIIEKLTALETEVIDVTGRDKTFRLTASLRPPEGVTPRNVSSVDVTVVIQRQSE